MTNEGDLPFAAGARFGQGDIPADVEDEYNRWYNEEHMGELVPVEGVVQGRRFVAIEGTPRYAALYDLAAVNVLTSPGWLEVVERWQRTPSEAHERIRPRFQNFTKAALELVIPQEAAPLLLRGERMGCLVFTASGDPSERIGVAAAELGFEPTHSVRLYREAGGSSNKWVLLVDPDLEGRPTHDDAWRELLIRAAGTSAAVQSLHLYRQIYRESHVPVAQ